MVVGRREHDERALVLVLARGGGGARLDAALRALRAPVDEVRDAAGHTPLHLAAIGDGPRACESLAAAGASLEARNVDGQTPLHIAAQRGCLAALKWLIAQGADVTAQDERFGDTPLHSCVWEGRVKCVLPLLQAGADATAKDADGCTPAELAKINRKHEAAALLDAYRSTHR